MDPLPAPGRTGRPGLGPARGADRGVDRQPPIGRSRPGPARGHGPAGHRARRAVGERDARARGAGGRQDARTGRGLHPVRGDPGPPAVRRRAGPQRDRCGCGLCVDKPVPGRPPVIDPAAPAASPNARRDRCPTRSAHAERTQACQSSRRRGDATFHSTPWPWRATLTNRRSLPPWTSSGSGGWSASVGRTATT